MRRESSTVIVLVGEAGAGLLSWLERSPNVSVTRAERAAEAVAAWRARRFELPDYYLVLAPPPDAVAGPDLHLGPLRAARPRRVAVADGGAGAAALLDTLRSLPHGPWWPPLDELLGAARHFFAGSLGSAPRN